MIIKYPIFAFILLVLWTICDQLPCVKSQRRRETMKSPVIRTTRGLLLGKTEVSSSGKLVDVFLGVPYANPPTGKRRFRPSEIVDPWDGVLNVTQHPLSCWQKLIPLASHIEGLDKFRHKTDMNEDCLKMNIWTPRTKTRKLPVLVWLYGGGFSRGGIAVDAYNGKTFATEEELIIISVNYRLASLGFLYLDSPDVPGNAGLFDQLTALKWINENIERFGGDPDKVTLLGQSAGAASVGYHLISPLSRNYFRHAILQSGAPHAIWAHVERQEALDKSKQLAEFLGCPKNNLSAAIACLQSAKPEEILLNEPQGEYDNIYTFKPVVDGHFIPRNPLEALKRRDFKKTNILTGTTKDEGTMLLIGFFPYFFSFREDVVFTHADFYHSVSRLFQMNDMIHESVVHQYTDWMDTKNSYKNIASISRAIGDFFFTCPVEDVADAFTAAGQKVFRYFFTHRSSNSLWPKWAGTFHGEDILYIFGEPMDPRFKYTNAEARLSRRVMRYWGNFARTGNPNITPIGDEMKINWPKYTKSGREYLVLAPNSTTVGSGLKVKQCAFWNHVIPKMMQHHAEEGKRKKKCT